MQRGRSRGCYRLGFKCLGSRRATKETEEGGEGQFWQIRERERENLWDSEVVSSNPGRGDFFPESRFFVFYSAFFLSISNKGEREKGEGG